MGMVEAIPGRRPMRQRIEDARSRAATTPGRLRVLALAIGLVTATLITVGSGALATALTTVTAMQQDTVPAILRMQHIHAWLSDADRSAATVYLTGGFDSSDSQLQFDAESAATSFDVLGHLNSDDPQLRYEADIAAASRELQRSTEHAPPGGEVSQRLHTVAEAVANYTRLAKIASAQEAQDIAAGTVYLQAGSNLMHGPGGILVQIDELRVLYAQDLDAANLTLQVTAGLLALYAGVAVALLVLLVHTQRFVTARFRRRRNNRLVAATMLLVIVTGGGGIGAARAAQAIHTGEDDSYARLLNLWNASALVYDATGNRYLSLISRGKNAQFDQAFELETARLVDRPLTAQMTRDAERGEVRFGGMLADELRSAASPAEWDSALHLLRAYQTFLQADASVRDQAAKSSRTSGRPFVPDRALGQAVNELQWYFGASMQMLQGQFDDDMASAQLTLALTAVLELMAIVVAALAFWGLQPRIDEYIAGV